MKKTEQNATGDTRSVARLAAQKEVVALEDQLQRADFDRLARYVWTLASSGPRVAARLMLGI